MWIFLLGPFLSLLPERWRKALPFYQSVHWRSAAVLSGLAESVIALGGLMYWYSYSVTTWVCRGLDLGHSPADLGHRFFRYRGYSAHVRRIYGYRSSITTLSS